MRKRSATVQSLCGLVRGAGGSDASVVFAALLLLGCGGTSESAGTGGAAPSGAGAAGSPSSSSSGGTSSFGGEEAIAGLAGRTSDGAGGTLSGGVGGRLGGGIIAGAGRAGGLGRAGSSGGGSVTDTSLGSACTSDAQCGGGMLCATASGTLFGTGGPSQGMCTMACTPGGTDCDTLKAGAECFDFGTDLKPAGYCLDACTQGEPLDLGTKCGGRSDFVCVDLGDSAPLPFCVPHCRSDAECGAGLFCDKSSLLGLCSKTKPPAGDPVGTACTPGGTNTCEGYCIRTSDTGVTPVTGACVELCSAGFECQYSSASSPAPGGFCGGALSDPFGPIDLGYCLANCSCSGDCKLPGDLCRKWPAADADLASALGAPGVCYPVLAESVELSCSKGGAGGGGGAGTPPQTAGTSGTGP